MAKLRMMQDQLMCRGLCQAVAWVAYRESMLRFRPRVGPFVWVPGPPRRRPRTGRAPWHVYAIIAIFLLGCPAGVLLAAWLGG